VWHILKLLTEDPDPTPEHEARYGGSNMDPATLSINTTRGEAMHAVVSYALWVRRHIDSQADAEDQPRRGFDEMPEVREVLDAHLNVAQEPSPAIARSTASGSRGSSFWIPSGHVTMQRKSSQLAKGKRRFSRPRGTLT